MKSREYDNNGKKTFVMVFSASNYLRIHKQIWMAEEAERFVQYKRVLNRGIQRVKDSCEALFPQFNFKIAVLYNGYTEDKHGEWFTENDFGFDAIYADSGGLQCLTLGDVIDDTLRNRIYGSQSMSSHAMSFDDIPAVSFSKSSKATNQSKVYFPDRAKDCAIRSAEYVKTQCEYMDSVNADAGVFYIVQGNNYNDMVEWFGHGDTVLTPENWNRINGVSLAFSCLGVGHQEQIETLLAYEKIKQQYGKHKTKNHIHLLGVGSASRLLPTYSYMQSGISDDDTVVSYDSTSLSMAYSMGQFLDNDGKMVKITGVQNAQRVFTKLVNYFWDIMEEEYQPEVTKEQLIEHLVQYRMSVSVATDIDTRDSIMLMLARTITPLYAIYQTLSLQEAKAAAHDVGDRYYLQLSEQCKTVDDFAEWYQTYQGLIPSKRVKRHGTYHEIDEFFA